MTLTLALAILLQVGCGGSDARAPRGALDRVEVHVARGEEALLEGRLAVAERAFDLALELDDAYAPALAGRAVVLAQQGRAAQAVRAASAARSAANTDLERRRAYIALVRVYRLAQPDEDWLEDALEAYEDALEADRTASDVAPQFFMARAWRDGFQLEQADRLYRQVLASRGPYTELANRELKELQGVSRALPSSRMGRQLAFAARISRADMAALLLAEFNLAELYQRALRRHPETFNALDGGNTAAVSAAVSAAERQRARDIQDHPLADDIRRVLKLHVAGLTLSPDRRFYPDAPLSRGEFALLAEDVLAHLSGDLKIKTRFIGQPSPFQDIRPSLHVFNAVMTVTTRDLIPPIDPLNGIFGPKRPVNGATALLVLRQLRAEAVKVLRR